MTPKEQEVQDQITYGVAYSYRTAGGVVRLDPSKVTVSKNTFFSDKVKQGRRGKKKNKSVWIKAGVWLWRMVYWSAVLIWAWIVLAGAIAVLKMVPY